MTTSELKPRKLANIVGETFRIYGRNFLKLLAIVAVVWVIPYILMYVWLLPSIETGAYLAPPAPITPTYIWTIVGIGAVLVIVVLVLFIVGYPLMGGAVIYAVSQQCVGQPIGIGQAYGSAWRRAGALIGATVLATLAVIGMAITIIGIPAAIYFGITWVFICQAALLEGYGARAALSRSAALVKNNWWRVLGIVLLLSIVGGIISQILGTIPVAGAIIGGILSTPIAIIGSTLLYYDLRLKKEGYTLEVMAQDVSRLLKEG